jgi:type III pantothenate kinase
MLLAIDIGNTHASLGFFSGDRLVKKFRITTPREVSATEFAGLLEKLLMAETVNQTQVEAVIASSVVPDANPIFTEALQMLCRRSPDFVDHTFPFGFRIKYEPPAAAGSDRLVDAFAAKEKYGAPCIVGDFGTATTIDAVNADGDYIGGTIIAGMGLMLEALSLKTAKLPKVELEKCASVIGASTVASIQSGVYFGYIGLVEGVIAQMKTELGGAPKVIATGGLANFLANGADGTNVFDVVDENLLLDGLWLIHKRKQ